MRILLADLNGLRARRAEIGSFYVDVAAAAILGCQKRISSSRLPLYVSRSHAPIPSTVCGSGPFLPSVYCHIVHFFQAGGITALGPYCAIHSQQLTSTGSVVRRINPFQIVTRVQSRPTGRCRLDVSNECARLLQRHARPLGVSFEIQDQEIALDWPYHVEKEGCLVHTGATDSEMIGAEKQPRIAGFFSVFPERWILEGGSLRRLLDHSHDSGCFRFP